MKKSHSRAYKVALFSMIVWMSILVIFVLLSLIAPKYETLEIDMTGCIDGSCQGVTRDNQFRYDAVIPYYDEFFYVYDLFTPYTRISLIVVPIMFCVSLISWIVVAVQSKKTQLGWKALALATLHFLLLLVLFIVG